MTLTSLQSEGRPTDKVIVGGSSALSLVLEAVNQSIPAREWVAASSLIVTERERVLDHLAIKNRSMIYGFDTMLGPLDNTAGTSQQELLDAHLHGRQFVKDSKNFRMITATKIQQISNGGTGIHPDTFAGLLAAISLDLEANGAWLDSYSSGDVVPASWWAKALQEAGAIEQLHIGDTIALINGHFVSTASGISALEELVDYFASFLAIASAFASPTPIRFQSEHPEFHSLAQSVWGVDKIKEQGTPSVQLPVSTRDGAFYLRAVVASLNTLGAALNQRLLSKSSNPQFHFGEGVTNLSQSSFLGFDLTTAATTAMQTLSLLMGAVHRFTSIRSYELQAASESPDMKLVQPPKLSSAIMREARMGFGAMPMDFTGHESGGVEDLWDLSLMSTNALSNMIQLAKSQLVPLYQLDPAIQVSAKHHEEIRQQLMGGLDIHLEHQQLARRIQ